MSSVRAAIVTGAARGIGRAIALQLAADGLDIALNDLPSNKDQLDQVRAEVEAKGRRAIVVTGDVSSEPDVQRIVDETADYFGRLDVMVANAGVMVVKPVIDTSVEDWHKAHNVNGLGTFLCYKHAAIKMRQLGNKSGRIIGASSVAGKMGEPFASIYCQTKFGIRGLTQALACEISHTGITVNCYCPGAVDTVMLRELAYGAGGVEPFYAIESTKSRVGYLGVPEDVANVVSFLASPASHFITGQSINVNGGRFME
ncbi:NAD(P)-binding protein [Schizophyllum commune H4-8]|uniref:NAD(P)-binding protein n=1 Tax=Schizophyllum commune (strain H4-8 / FGSC 9210) TaxID=578458 RepID=UPI00215F8DB2|nr:NAD(P)-binding protein [Schizophyllum commune H4-8]KAI5888269.1 NAD(P)-binding protein [Schizophyllum commune H4-8]